MVIRRFVAAIAVIVAFAVSAPPSKAAASAEMIAQGRAMIQGIVDEVVSLLDRKDITIAERDKRFQVIFRKNFNVPALGRYALGRYWRKASEAQRAEYLKVFERFVVKIYSVRLGQFAGEKIKIVSARPDTKGVVVESEIITGDSKAPIVLKWRIRETKSGLKIVDVVIENISMALTQKQDFASVMRQRNDGIDALVAALERKIKALDAKSAKKTKKSK